MPVFELPWDQLVVYRGRTPAPPDHQEFWDSALAEMHALGGRVRLEPASFEAPGVECFHLTFSGVGGARVHAKFVRPRHATSPSPAVLLFHGYSGNSGDWINLLPWASAGLVVAALDCRGQGGLSQDVGGHAGWTLNGHIVRGLEGGPHTLLFRSIFLDCAQLARIVLEMPEVDAERVSATGGSQGGGLTIACAALEPRISRAAPIFPFLSDYRRVWEMDLAVAAYEELRTWFRLFDPRHEREDEVFRTLSYIDVQHLAPRIRAEVLFILGMMDTICPPLTQMAAYNRITSPKSVVRYPDHGHEELPGARDEIFQFITRDPGDVGG